MLMRQLMFMNQRFCLIINLKIILFFLLKILFLSNNRFKNRIYIELSLRPFKRNTNDDQTIRKAPIYHYNIHYVGLYRLQEG